MGKLDKQFVKTWSGRYVAEEMGVGSAEQRLLGVVGPAVRARGYFEKSELAEVGEWKTVRIRSRLAENTQEDIADITAMALAAPERFAHRILSLLSGVGSPVASAILTVVNPEVHTILDFRAVEALDELYRLGLLANEPPFESSGLPGYLSYLEYCRSVAAQTDSTLRDLDRALWKWSREGMPTP